MNIQPIHPSQRPGNPHCRSSPICLAAAILCAATCAAHAADAADAADISTSETAPPWVLATSCPAEHRPGHRLGHCNRRSQDDVWLISSRHLGCPDHDSQTPLRFWRMDRSDVWKESDRRAFLATDDPGVETRIWVHGNRIDFDDALAVGRLAYGGLVADGVDERPVRYVIWHWPADKMHGQLRDVRTKADLALVHSYYLARLLRDVDARVSLSVVGYSFGPRLITAALHLASGGTLSGRALDRPWSADRAPVRIALVAAALDDDWLSPGGAHDRALDAVDHMLLINNCFDPALKRYRFLYRYGDARALGFSGLPNNGSLPGDKLDEEDVSRLIGHSHDYRLYLTSPYIMERIRAALSAGDEQQRQENEPQRHRGAEKRTQSLKIRIH